MDSEAARRTLNKALSRLNPGGTWPVNLNGILARLGIELRYEPPKGKPLSHLQLGDSPTLIIYRHNQDALLSTRERFSIAHELAHWVLWRRFDSLPSSETEYWWHETICNEFAARLLVPPSALSRFLDRLYGENIDPAHFPDRVKRSAAVSWEVAARSITSTTSSTPSDLAYLRLINIAGEDTGKDGQSGHPKFKVNCSTLTKMPGSFVAQSAHLPGEHELVAWMSALPQRSLRTRFLTIKIGNLRLTNVPCTFLRQGDYWIIHFRPSHEGVHVETSLQVT